MFRCHGFRFKDFFPKQIYRWAPKGPTSAIFATIAHDPLNFELGTFRHHRPPLAKYAIFSTFLVSSEKNHPKVRVPFFMLFFII